MKIPIFLFLTVVMLLFEVTYRTSFNNGTSNTKNLALEKCVFGKNIEEKHRDALKDLKINEYYCFNNNDGNLALFYDPEEGKVHYL